MIVKRVKLENWKNFHECNVLLTGRCFVVGANASGKSNFLDVFRFLRDITKVGGGLQTAVADRGGIKKIRCLAARAKTNVSIYVELGETAGSDVVWSYFISFKHTGGGIQKNEVTIIKEEVCHNGKVLLSRTEKTQGEDTETLKFTHIEQPTANKEFRELKNFFDAVQYLNVVPQMVRESGSVLFSNNKEDYYGRNFLLRLSSLNERIRNSYFKKINSVLRLAVPQLDNLSLVKDSMGVPHLEAIYKHWRASGSKQQETQFSDGTLRLIGFLFALIDSNGLTLLEEPESNLHTAIVAQFPEYIARMQREKKGRQVILTTHSYDMLSNMGIGENEVLLLRNTNEGTEIVNITDVEQIRSILAAGFSVADAVLPQSAPQEIKNLSQLDV